MIEGRALRTWLAAGIAAATTALVLTLSRDAELSIITLVGSAAAAIVAATIGDDEKAARAPSAITPDAMPSDVALEAVVGPVLVLHEGRVARANRAARTLLGEHIMGEDARVAIRHPGAIDLLTREVDVAADPVELIGLGRNDGRWQMHVMEIAPAMRLVHLLDQTGHYAAERMRVDFVANASHELRTPLASILGYVETLTEEAGEDAALRRRFLSVVMNEARRMQLLVEELMSLSRIEAEKFRLPDTAVDMAGLLHEVHASIAEAQAARGGDVACTVEPGLPAVLADRVQLSQLLHNLIGNAMKYGRAGTPIVVTLARGAGDTVVLVVEDQGDGIAPEHLPRLTERFYRADPGRSRSLGGTGLGLAIVKHIVERHRGRLDIASTPGVGTRVSVSLRAAPAAAVMKT